jgi:hypothetical protein
MELGKSLHPSGRSVASLCGERGSPSMLMISPLRTWTSVAHATEQNRQMRGTVLLFRIT